MSVLKQIFEKKITSIEKKKKLKSIDELENEIANNLIPSHNFFDVLILAVPHKEILKKFNFFRKKIKKINLIIDIKSALKKGKFSQITL